MAAIRARKQKLQQVKEEKKRKEEEEKKQRFKKKGFLAKMVSVAKSGGNSAYSVAKKQGSNALYQIGLTSREEKGESSEDEEYEPVYRTEMATRFVSF